MSTPFQTWNKAHVYALSCANEFKRPMGLEKTKEYGRTVYIVRMVPIDPANRYGWETRCEIVNPGGF